MKSRKIKIRVNDIGAEPTSYLGKKPENAHFCLSIVRYTKNQYYGMLDTYLKDGWVDKGDCITCSNCSIDKNCFVNKETNYVIAFLKLDPDIGESTLESVGDRLLYIEDRDREDFWKVYKLADTELHILAEYLEDIER